MIRAKAFTNTVFVWVALAVLVLAALLGLRHDHNLQVYYYRVQDLPVVVVMLSALALAAFRVPRVNLPERAPKWRSVLTVAAILALVLWAGTYWLMYDYPLTRDEHMAVFDMGIFQGGKLAQPLAPQWRDYAEALVPNFLLDVPGNALLVSGYMPGNAMLRAAFASVGDPALLNPLLFAIGLIALHDIARRLFAEQPRAVWVVLAAYVLSAQMLVNAMTTYAMTAHAALNLVWLALFLRGKPWQHALAMLVGLWAIGLHQVVFHPLFAGPIILTLLAQRRWALFGAYAAVYATGLLFWFGYPAMVVGSFGIAAQTGSTGGVGHFVTDRVLPLLTDHNAEGLVQMGFNAVRFVAWSPVFLIPFAAMAVPDIRANRGLALPLFAGILLTFAAMLLLLPSQGHGWGYRYLHPVAGNFALLAGYGYAHWSQRDPARAGGAFALLGATTLLVTLPMQLWAAHAFVRPYAVLAHVIAAQDADFVIVDTDTSRAAIDQVRNRADLANRPLILASHELTAGQVSEVCRRGTVIAVGADTFRKTGFYPDVTGNAGPRFTALTRALAMGGCLRPVR